MAKDEVKLKNIIAYGMGDIYGGGAFLLLGTLYMLFLTDIVGLNPALAGSVVVIGKVWDAVSDPLMGYISDNIDTKYGRRRIFFLIGIIPITISFISLWIPLNTNSNLFLFIYYSFAYIFFSTVFTMVMVPYSALNAEMSENFEMRTKLSTSRMAFSQFSALISGVLPKYLIDYLNQGTLVASKYSYLVMGIVFGLLYALPWLFVYKGTWEIPYEVDNKTKLIEKIKKYKTVLYNKSFKIHLGMYISAYLAMDFLMALFIYYLTYYIQKPDIFPFCMLAILLSQIVMLPVYMKISNKKGKGLAYSIGLTIWGLGMFSLLFLSSTTPLFIIILICILIGSGLSAGVMIPWAILPTISDIDQIINIKRRTGIYSGLMTFIRKIAQAVALWLVGIILSLINYVPNQPQSPQTLFYLKYVFVFVPIILIISGIIFSYKYKVTPEKQKILIQEIKRIKKGGKKENADPKVKEVCEELTGIKYR